MSNTISSSMIDIAASGMRAQAGSLKAIANNIANSTTSRMPGDGKVAHPYRRQQAIMAAGEDMTGVKLVEVAADTKTAFKDVYMPGHPDANGNGYVSMPNVDLPVEMMNMVSASRIYQANATVMKKYVEGLDQTLELLK